MNPTDGAWWWEYALDGAVGGVLGGVATGLAVWWTVRFERRHTETVELRQSLDLLQTRLMEIHFAMQDRDDQMAWSRALVVAFTTGSNVASRAFRQAPELRTDVKLFLDRLRELHQIVSRDPEQRMHLRNLVARMGGRINQWQRDPKAYKSLSTPEWLLENEVEGPRESTND